MKFQYMGLSSSLLRAIADAGYDKPTPIQWQAIPAVLQGKDVLGIAQTGTGKTAGFTLPMIDKLSQGQAKARMPRSLILEPTRELAAQVAESFEKYGKHHKLSCALLIGGVSMHDQVAELDRGVDVLIATPGRLLDHFQRGNLMLSGVKILVIDEADRMLDMGFIPDVEEICTKIAQKHQSLLFSATMPPIIKKLADKFLIDPKIVEVASQSTTAETITQSIRRTAPKGKIQLLRDLLKSESVNNAIVFCNRKVEVKEVYKALKSHKFNAAQLHGDMQQSERMEVLSDFKEGKVTILVASDVAARGLDIPSVSHVFNFDIPTQSEDYVHRIGRTGRAGRKGTSITFVTNRDEKYLESIEKMLGKKLTSPDSSPQPVKADAAPKDDVAKTGPKPNNKRSRPPRNRAKKPLSSEQNPQSSEQNKTEAKPQNNRHKKNTNQEKSNKNNNKHNKPNAKPKASSGFGDNVPAFLK
jgi:superfamily II DNA/RNA helicase